MINIMRPCTVLKYMYKITNLISHRHCRIHIKCQPTTKESVLAGGATTSSKLGIQFFGLGYYYPSTEKNLDRSTQFGAVGYIITLYLSKSYVKSWGSVQIFFLGGGLDPHPPTPHWLRRWYRRIVSHACEKSQR